MLVDTYHQPIDQAWRFTLREFIEVANVKNSARKNASIKWDGDSVVDLENHIRSLGVKL